MRRYAYFRYHFLLKHKIQRETARRRTTTHWLKDWRWLLWKVKNKVKRLHSLLPRWAWGSLVSPLFSAESQTDKCNDTHPYIIWGEVDWWPNIDWNRESSKCHNCSSLCYMFFFGGKRGWSVIGVAIVCDKPYGQANMKGGGHATQDCWVHILGPVGRPHHHHLA